MWIYKLRLEENVYQTIICKENIVTVVERKNK